MIIKTKIKFKSFNAFKLTKIIDVLIRYARTIKLEPSTINFKKKVKRLTILKSPHVHKKSRDQYELVTSTKTLFFEGTNDQVKNFFEYLENENTESIHYFIHFEKYIK